MNSSPFLRTHGLQLAKDLPKTNANCKVFGECGGCAYLNLSYENELWVKQSTFEALLQHLDLDIKTSPIVSSPIHEAYRIKISPQFKKLNNGQTIFGNAPFGKKSILEIDACPIALPVLSDNICQLRKQLQTIPHKKKRGCLVMRSDGDSFKWGGLGKGSLNLKPEEYLKFEWQDKTVHYSLNTFFQANPDILPNLFHHLEEQLKIDQNTHFYDLYGGVGLFAMTIGSHAGAVTLVELEKSSIELAHYNKDFNKLDHLDIHSSAVEDLLPLPASPKENMKKVAMIDPPRAGLKPEVIEHLNLLPFQKLAYLSCNPETQIRDLKHFFKLGWKLDSLTPYDFFPRSYHIESLAILTP